MGRLKKLAGKLLLRLIMILMAVAPGRAVVNAIYERSGWRFRNFIFLGLKQRGWLPKASFRWKVRLLNGKTALIPVKAGDELTWELALLYLWHDIGLSKLEQVLASYYRKLSYADVGANLGTRSLLMMSEGNACTLFEPNAELLGITREIKSINGYDNATIEELGVSDETGTTAFYVADNPYLSSLDADSAAEQSDVTRVEIQTVTLDDYFKSDLPAPAYIKVDVEGCELKVLHGAAATLAKTKPDLVLEIFPDDPTKGDIYSLLNGLGYSCYEVVVDIGRPLNDLQGCLGKPLTAEDFAQADKLNFFFSANAGLQAHLNDQGIC